MSSSATFCMQERGNESTQISLTRSVLTCFFFDSSGNLTFLNGWENPLGLEILTPFGRQQLFNLGASFRAKYGGLLKEGQRPVFRTESQDRMVKSALNFAAGFFGSECLSSSRGPTVVANGVALV